MLGRLPIAPGNVATTSFDCALRRPTFVDRNAEGALRFPDAATTQPDVYFLVSFVVAHVSESCGGFS